MCAGGIPVFCVKFGDQRTCHHAITSRLEEAYSLHVHVEAILLHVRLLVARQMWWWGSKRMYEDRNGPTQTAKLLEDEFGDQRV